MSVDLRDSRNQAKAAARQRSASRCCFHATLSGKTPGKLAGSLVRVGSDNGHLVRRTEAVRRKGVAHGGSEVHLRGRTARFLTRFIRQPHAKAGARQSRSAKITVVRGLTS